MTYILIRDVYNNRLSVVLSSFRFSQSTCPLLLLLSPPCPSPNHPNPIVVKTTIRSTTPLKARRVYLEQQSLVAMLKCAVGIDATLVRLSLNPVDDELRVRRCLRQNRCSLRGHQLPIHIRQLTGRALLSGCSRACRASVSVRRQGGSEVGRDGVSGWWRECKLRRMQER